MFLKPNTNWTRWFWIPDMTANAGLTGLSATVQIAKNGASAFTNPWAGPTGLTEIANGWYKADFNTPDSDTLGPLRYQITWGGSNSYGEQDEVGVNTDLYGSVTEGIGGDLNGNVTGTVAGVTGSITGSVLGLTNARFGPTRSSQAGSTSTTLVLSSSEPSTPDGCLVGDIIRITNASKFEYRMITGYVGSTRTATVHRAWDYGTPATGTQYLLAGMAQDGMALSASGINAILDLTDGVESGWTPRQLLRLLLALIGGDITWDGTNFVVQNPAGTKNRVTGTASNSTGRDVTATDVS